MRLTRKGTKFIQFGNPLLGLPEFEVGFGYRLSPDERDGLAPPQPAKAHTNFQYVDPRKLARGQKKLM